MFSQFFGLSPIFQALIIFLFIVNIITFITFGLDKMRSRGNGRRTPEKTLWLLTLLGGSPAALLSMKYFRHKTKKLSFQAVIVLILAIQVAMIFFLFSFFQKNYTQNF
jgi:uncharacterized membrane protein YsdA (DUF1294 family)